MVIISKRNIFFRIITSKPISFRGFSVIFPLQLDFTEDISIDEIKDKLFDFYGLNEIDLENITNHLQGENNSKTSSRKKLINKKLKILVNEIILELKYENNDFIIFEDNKRIQKVFFNCEENAE